MRFLSLLLAAVTLAAPACAATQSGESSSGIRGLVLRGPLQPICTIGRPCEGPAARVALAVVRAGRIVARIRTGADGRFRVALAPGRYTVRTTGTQAGIGKMAASAAAVVGSGTYTRVTLRIDTGIR